MGLCHPMTTASVCASYLYMTCIHTYLTCIHPYMTCIHTYINTHRSGNYGRSSACDVAQALYPGNWRYHLCTHTHHMNRTHQWVAVAPALCLGNWQYHLCTPHTHTTHTHHTLHTPICHMTHMHRTYDTYGVVLVSRIDKIIGLFCKRDL